MRLFWNFIFVACLCHEVSIAKLCSTSGRFPNDAVEDCRGYTMCIPGAAGAFLEYNLTCPLSFVYSPLEKLCTNVTHYQCNAQVSFDCTTIGTFENSLSLDCSSFIICVEALNDSISPRVIGCPQNSVFSPTVGGCVNETEYQCVTVPVVSEVLQPVDTINRDVTTEIETRFNGAGRFNLKYFLPCFVVSVQILLYC